MQADDHSPDDSAGLKRLRWRFLAWSGAAGFVVNVIGSVFAERADLFWLAQAGRARMVEALGWLLHLPFIFTGLMFAAYMAPLFRGTLQRDVFRRKVLDMPAFFVTGTVVGWVTGAVEQVVLPLFLAPDVPVSSPLLSFIGVVGIALASSTAGYFLLEYLNRIFWIPQLFDNRLEAYKSRLQFSLRWKFTLYYLGVALAPVLVLGWVLLWADLAHGVFSPTQRVFVLAFVAFALVLGIKTSAILMRMLRQPLLDAHAATERIRQGQFAVNLRVNSNDELGVLSERINEMSHALGAHVRQITTLQGEIERTQREVVFTMGAIGESRSRETGNHVQRVAEYSRVLALAWGLDETEAQLLKHASPMHDIGKVAIPDAILNKPGRLTADEFEVMKTHAQLGFDLLCHSDRALLKAAAIIALQHHEKFDGSGYPQGLAGDAIHIYGRITALADVFDALGSARVYKAAWPDDEIFALLRAQRGRNFDPRLIDLFFANLDQMLKIRATYRDDEPAAQESNAPAVAAAVPPLAARPRHERAPANTAA